MLVDKDDILQLLPQRPPMVMVDGLMAYHKDACTSRLQLSSANLFCKDSVFHEAGLIENMAQTAALHSGYAALQDQKKARTGYIGALKRFSLHKLPKDNDALTTQVNILHKLLDALVIKASVFVEDDLMAEAEMNIFLMDGGEGKLS